MTKIRTTFTRREFLGLCSKMAVVSGLSTLYVPKIAQALEKAIRKPSVIWLNFSSCTGCTESFIKSECPTISDIILNLISLDFNETIMACAGEAAEHILSTAQTEGGYICIIEGSIPLKHGFGRIHGSEMMEIAQKITSKAARVIAVGSCASYGGVASASPNPSEARGVGDVLGIDVINIPGCPSNPEWILSTIVNVLMLGKCPDLDAYSRPKNIFGLKIHDNCERRAHFDAGRYIEVFGSQAAGENHCLYKLGCKGTATHSNCPIVKWNGGANWCVQARSPCIGCVEPGFWDEFAPFYERMPNVSIPGISGIEATADRVGTVLGVATVAGIGAHIVGSAVREKKREKKEKEEE